MLIAAFGVILSLLGIFMVKTKEGASQLQLLRALDRGINTSSVLIVAASFLVIHLLGLSYWICGSVITGLLTGIVIGKATEYYTSHAYKPTQDIAKSSGDGSCYRDYQRDRNRNDFDGNTRNYDCGRYHIGLFICCTIRYDRYVDGIVWGRNWLLWGCFRLWASL